MKILNLFEFPHVLAA